MRTEPRGGNRFVGPNTKKRRRRPNGYIGYAVMWLTQFGLIKVTYIFYLVNWTEVIAPASQAARHNRKMINIMCQTDLHVVVIAAERLNRYRLVLVFFSIRGSWSSSPSQEMGYFLSSISANNFQFKFEPPLDGNHWLFGGQLCVNNGIES